MRRQLFLRIDAGPKEHHGRKIDAVSRNERVDILARFAVKTADLVGACADVEVAIRAEGDPCRAARSHCLRRDKIGDEGAGPRVETLDLPTAIAAEIEPPVRSKAELSWTIDPVAADEIAHGGAGASVIALDRFRPRAHIEVAVRTEHQKGGVLYSCVGADKVVDEGAGAAVIALDLIGPGTAHI